MVDLTNIQLPPPSNWQDFERLCRHLFREIWRNPSTQRQGGAGQAQQGVDVFGLPKGTQRYAGVQCKVKDARLGHRLTVGELKEEVEKAKSFSPPLGSLIVATTANNDAKIQAEARRLTIEHQTSGLFDVDVWGWEEIHARLCEYPDVLRTHYPQHFPEADASESSHSFDLIAIGPNVICTGRYLEIAESHWTLLLDDFIVGEISDLISYIDGFQVAPADDRYLLVNETGDGRILGAAPVLTTTESGYAIRCPVLPALVRTRAQELGSQLAISPTTNDLYIENGNIARVSGLAALPQRLRDCLSIQRGELFHDARSGARSAEYYGAFSQSLWLGRLLKLEIIRHAAIPTERTYAPIPCIDRVRDIEVLSEKPEKGWIRVRIDADINGVGRWSDEISILVELNRSQVSK